jgi:hypothetical protein
MAKKKLPGRMCQRGDSWIVDIREPDGTRFRKSFGSNKHMARKALLFKRAQLREAEKNGETKGPTVGACWRRCTTECDLRAANGNG